MSVVGLRHVAERAGVSAGTVSNFINHPGKVAPATGDRIRDAIRDLGYVGNDAARALRVGGTEMIGHLTFEVGTPFFFDFSKGVQERALESGYSVLIANTAGSLEGERRYLDLFESQRMRGLLLSPLGDVRRRVASFSERGVPVVLIDRHLDGADCSSVSVDDVAGGRLAIDHLLELGRRRILFVGGPLGLDPVADRLNGARQAARAVPGASLKVLETSDRTIRIGREVGRDLAAEPTRLPDAIFAANDLLAIGLLQGLLEGGSISVPDDVAIVGYDDIDFAMDAVISLTSVKRPGEMFGRTALDVLHRQIGGSGPVEHITFQPTLVARRSTLGAQQVEP